MEVWRIILYGCAALWALRALTTLMTAHRDRLRAEYAAKEALRERDELASQRRSRSKGGTAA